MPIHQIATYQVKPAAVGKVRRAIEEFVEYVKTHEPGARVYAAWQQADDPTRFAHIFIFENQAAQATHSQSEAVKRFQAVYKPELVGGPVVFTNYESVAARGMWAPGDVVGA